MMRFWIARDKNGKIYLYDTIPYKEETRWNSHQGYLKCLHRHQFLDVKWEDETPTEVKLVLKK